MQKKGLSFVQYCIECGQIIGIQNRLNDKIDILMAIAWVRKALATESDIKSINIWDDIQEKDNTVCIRTNDDDVKEFIKGLYVPYGDIPNYIVFEGR